MKKKILLIPMIIFLCFVFLMSALFIITPKSDYSSLEKRYLEDFPETGLSTVTSGEFEKGFESFLADHFPFRNMWVGFNAYYNYLIGNNGNDGVYKCSDGYLINAPIKADNRVKTNIGTIKKFSENIDVPLTVMFAPSTGYVMSDKLPAIHNEYIDDEVFDEISGTLSKSDIGFVDLRESFKAAAENGEQLYYRTDHHWTTKGAYTAYSGLCDKININAKEKSGFNIESFSGFYGTTYSTSGFWLTKPDEIEIWKNKNESVRLTITEGSESKEYNSLYFKNHLDEDDKYPVFIDGNHALEKIENKNVKDGRVLVIKDSFCHSLAPFLSENFNTVTLVDMRYYKNSVSEMVNDGNYDRVFVIYGIDNFATDTDLVWLK